LRASRLCGKNVLLRFYRRIQKGISRKGAKRAKRKDKNKGRENIIVPRPEK
jgi:hypothetical protein